MAPDARLYMESHPWLSFQYATSPSPLWALLGEAFSKAQHLAGTALQPGLAAELGAIYLAKGAHATTAIEGNTLTEDQVRRVVDKTSSLPPSQQYLGQEVENVVKALHHVRSTALQGAAFSLSAEWVRDRNAEVLEGLSAEDHVVPGEYRTISVKAGKYLAAPAEDVPYLMDRLEQWLNGSWLDPNNDPGTPDDHRFFRAFMAAVLAHLYIAWIHPFGDGNGRTARLVEAAILAHSGIVPWVSCNLLSDHYNKTRDEYYRRLQAASEKNDVAGFIVYAAQGFVDGLRDQIVLVQAMQRRVAWVNYVHEVMGLEPKGDARDRRRYLALHLPADTAVPKARIAKLDVDVVQMYVGKSDKTVTRDLNRLRELKLIEQVSGGWIAAVHTMDAFVPAHVAGRTAAYLASSSRQLETGDLESLTIERVGNQPSLLDPDDSAHH